MELDKTNDQTSHEESNGSDNQPESKKLEVNGKEMTQEQLLESYNSLQSEFTKKSQKLSEFEKKGNDIDEVKQKADNADKADKIRAEEEVFNTFKTDFNSLSETQLKAIRDLQAMDNTKTFEDVAKTYGMLNEAQLSKSKNGRQIMGNNIGVRNEQKTEVTLSDKARRIHNIKTPERLAEIKEKMGL